MRVRVRVCDPQREEEVARRQVLKEARRIERERRLKKEPGREAAEEEDEDEDDEEDLPSIFLPDPPSPLYCGFRSEPGMFWLSMVRGPPHQARR